MSEPRSPLRLHLGGGAMTEWRDAVADSRAVVEAVRRMIPAEGRVLVAGPHPPSVTGLLADHRYTTTHLRRSYADALAVAQRFPDRRNVDVWCGGLDKFYPEEPFDVVVALDGFGRLNSVESEQLGWAEVLNRLVGMLTADGQLITRVENPLGIHRLVDIGDGVATPAGAWAPAPVRDPTAPRGLPRLDDSMRRCGLAVTGAYAEYPGATPATLITLEALRRGADLPDWLRIELTAAAAAAYADQVVLSDPRRLIGDALRAGLGAELAPGWLLLAGRGDGGARRPALPAVLGVTGRRDPFWDVAYELVGTTVDAQEDGAQGAPERTILGGPEARQTRAIGRVLREPDALSTPPPGGRSLTEVLLDLCAAHDVRGLRAILTGYASWLTELSEDSGELPGVYCFATTDNVLVSGDTFLIIDQSWRLAEPLPLPLALARFLRAFAVSLLAGGYPHPWPPSMDANALTVTLAALAGHPVDRAAPGHAAALEAELTAVLDGLGAVEEHRLLHRLNTDASGSVSVSLHGFREAVALSARLQEELASAREQIAWHGEMLTSREQALERAYRTEDMLLKSISFRIGRLITAPGRLVRTVFHRLRAPAR